ncbi:hypothetical protein PV371_35885 [Streptomyces sp. TX20-6-3]|uniref:hypothetical protein n=1 Tax=Streptomyces sp. TX20-6-3 TaxID=3028705 RepID=UPI0029B993C6|nr:hypothetical protein [Streptomyces sp. TX20-6-3]MDX2565008.1 hypothetical protein [Streptomyces sp. TX20-6-3]
MTAIPLVLDGYLDELPVPGDDGLTARFRVISSPTDDATDETVFACHAADPHVAHALLNLMQPGDLLRIGGHLAVPGPGDGGGPRLAVDSLELLTPAPARNSAEMTLDRYSSYLVVFNSAVDTVQVFAEDGTWVGTAEHADAITDLIHAHEAGNPPPTP